MTKAIFRLFPLAVAVLVLYVSYLSLSKREFVLKTISSQLSLLERPTLKISYLSINSPKDIVSIRCEAVKPVTYTKVVSLAPLPIEKKKEKFIELMLPSVLIGNYEVELVRRNLEKIKRKLSKGYKLSRDEIKLVEEILDRCRVDSLEEALERANPVPPSLVIAQAAVESGWGTSRFFVEGNNPFGIWSFGKNSETIKAFGSGVRLKRYGSILEAVRDYLYNVNVGWAYEGFRGHRLKSMNPLELAEHLTFYSIRRDMYIQAVKKVIVENELHKLDGCRLSVKER